MEILRVLTQGNKLVDGLFEYQFALARGHYHPQVERDWNIIDEVNVIHEILNLAAHILEVPDKQTLFLQIQQESPIYIQEIAHLLSCVRLLLHNGDTADFKVEIEDGQPGPCLLLGLHAFRAGNNQQVNYALGKLTRRHRWVTSDVAWDLLLQHIKFRSPFDFRYINPFSERHLTYLERLIVKSWQHLNIAPDGFLTWSVVEPQVSKYFASAVTEIIMAYFGMPGRCCVCCRINHDARACFFCQGRRRCRTCFHGISTATCCARCGPAGDCGDNRHAQNWEVEQQDEPLCQNHAPKCGHCKSSLFNCRVVLRCQACFGPCHEGCSAENCSLLEPAAVNQL
jgi:hypothetical protein